MLAGRYRAKVLEKTWLTPTVVRLRFKPNRSFHFKAGQFLSVFIPLASGETIRRAYSLANSYPVAIEKGYELCIKVEPEGKGSPYMASLKAGDFLDFTAPYGDFLLHENPSAPYTCFIGTGTGIAPFKSFCLSEAFTDNPPEETLLVFGCASEEEILYPGVFETLGCSVIHCVSRPKKPSFQGFKGRLTDYLKQLPNHWPWHSTQFYLCGHPAMVLEVRRFLSESRGVPQAHIAQELYSPQTSARALKAA